MCKLFYSDTDYAGITVPVICLIRTSSGLGPDLKAGCTYQIIMSALVKTYMFHGSPTRQLKPEILHFTSTTVNAP